MNDVIDDDDGDNNEDDDNDDQFNSKELLIVIEKIANNTVTYDRTNITMNQALFLLAKKYSSYLSINKLLGLILIVEAKYNNNKIDDPPILKCIENGEIGGLFLHRSNVPNTFDDVRHMIHKYQQASTISYGSMLPLFITSDDEGGHRINYPNVYQQWPSLMAIGATNDPLRAYHYGRGYGSELYNAGMNIVFSPDADVNGML